MALTKRVSCGRRRDRVVAIRRQVVAEELERGLVVFADDNDGERFFLRDDGRDGLGGVAHATENPAAAFAAPW